MYEVVTGEGLMRPCFKAQAAISSLKEQVEGIQNLDQSMEILIRLLCAILGWSEKNVQVLQLDLCGQCMSDISLAKAFAPKGLPALTTVSLKGACRILDAGLGALVKCAPALRSLNLSQCSLLTDTGISYIANSLGSNMRELYLDECDSLDAKCILPALKELKHLEVLSLRGLVSVSDKFMVELIGSNGQNMKELLLGKCGYVIDFSLINAYLANDK